ncbi:MAG: hypothetical protein ABSG48_05680 [Geobacteraceae bacterium]
MKTGKYLSLMALLLALLSPVPVSADITFYVSPGSDNDFFIEGDNITETESVEITVVYDSTILANPRVSLEGGTVTNILYPNPGIVTFKANRGGNLNHSFEAHLNFDRKWDSQGGLFSVTGKLMEPDGTISPSRTTLNLATPSLLTFASNDGEQAPSPEKSAATEASAPSGSSPNLLMKSEKSVVQRFKEFKGERGLKAFVALFERSPRDILVQEPPVALSDGKTPVRITLSLQPKGGNAPDIALSDAKLVHLGNEGEKGWVITALPNEGTWNASLLIKMDEKIIEFPLVVAPSIKIEQGISERNFLVALNRYLVDQAAERKSESDPRRRYIDEYIFTANCLAKGITTVMAGGN